MDGKVIEWDPLPFHSSSGANVSVVDIMSEQCVWLCVCVWQTERERKRERCLNSYFKIIF